MQERPSPKGKVVNVQALCVSLENTRVLYQIVIHDLAHFNLKRRELSTITNSYAC